MLNRLLLTFYATVVFLCCNQALAQVYTLAWDPHQEPSLAGYNLYVLPEGSKEGFILWKRIGLTEIDPENPSIQVSGFEKYRKYIFFMTAFDELGNESQGSNSACGRGGASCAAADPADGRMPDERWRWIDGSVSFQGEPVCAIVLANGQHCFSCDAQQGVGNYRMIVPVDEDGTITVQAFANGLAPYKRVTHALDSAVDVEMKRRQPADKEIDMNLVHEKDAPLPEGWARISGSVKLVDTPVCAMVLANGQHVFSCGSEIGRYGLSVPLDSNGQITVFGFAHGFQPCKQALSPAW
ncbi:MAG: hypothetical protein CR984_06640 [Proteobacteria bacterium]|nr:MAG: hypothetical protein CR984_06640 [Pseudomonadota bacterium]